MQNYTWFFKLCIPNFYQYPPDLDLLYWSCKWKSRSSYIYYNMYHSIRWATYIPYPVQCNIYDLEYIWVYRLLHPCITSIILGTNPRCTGMLAHAMCIIHVIIAHAGARGILYTHIDVHIDSMVPEVLWHNILYRIQEPSRFILGTHPYPYNTHIMPTGIWYLHIHGSQPISMCMTQ